MARYFIRFSYNGTNYHGWQLQPNAISVQEVLNRSISIISREEICVVAAGRTDTGVHAKEMYGHIDFQNFVPDENFIFKINSFLPQDIAVYEIQKVKEDAHARFDATIRKYEYWISNKKDPFMQGKAWMFYKQLDVDKMNKAAFLLLGRHDFESFSKTHSDVNNFFCTIEEANWVVDGHYYIFHIKANRFLRNMVRAIVGTLVDVGLGKMSMKEFENAIAAKDRAETGTSVPGDALYLCEVKYPDSIFE